MSVPVPQIKEPSMILNCPSCAVRLKMTKPPAPEQKQVTCPRCGQAIPLRSSEITPSRPKPSAPSRTPGPPREAPDRRERPDREPDEREESALARRPRKKAKATRERSPWVMPACLAGAVVVAGVIVYVVLRQTDEEPGTAPTAPPNYSAARAGSPSGRPGPSIALLGRAPAGPTEALANGSSAAAPAPVLPVDRWLQDVEEAKRQAAQQKKDLFLAFVGSDWDDDSKHLKEVFDDPAFLRELGQHYIPVYLDFPRRPAAQAKVKDAARNAKVKDQLYAVDFPLLIYADAQGLPYAGAVGYEGGGTFHYLAVLDRNVKAHQERDRLRERVEQAFEKGKLEFATELYEYLRKGRVVRFYGTWVGEWVKLADKFDPVNAHGYSEIFFEAQWIVRLATLGEAVEKDDERDDQKPGREGEAKKLADSVQRFDEWKKQYRFKDPNVAVRLHLLAAYLTQQAGKDDMSVRYGREALAFKPTDKRLKKQLTSLAGILQRPSSGTGFVIAPGGYIVTNHHVVKDDGEVFVRIPPLPEPVAAKVVSSDELNDLALIQIPPGIALRPVPLSQRRQVSRGDQVAALGFPLGEAIGSGLKLTTGAVSAVPEEKNKNMMLLDARINPGNSGGPLCDEAGNVVGIVTLKLQSSERVDSYGLARPAWDIETFLKKRLPGYKPLKARTRKVSWADVDRLVSPSVLMVIHVPPKVDNKD